MKNIYKVWVLAAVVLMGTVTTGCERSNEVEALRNPYEPKQQQQQQEDDSEELDEMGKTISAIPGVSNVHKDYELFGDREGYYFYVDQLVDNSDVSKGTFKQMCFLEITDLNAPVMLYTNGYELSRYISGIEKHHIAKYLNCNSLYVEHRYFGESQPEPKTNINFTFLNAEQSAADLHQIVTLMKKYLFTKGNKWVSTGTSKCGINTTLYAYYSDKYGWNDIDLYMPFCAPFLAGTAESSADKSVGTYLKDVCGSGYPAGTNEDKAYKLLRAYPAAIVNNKALRDACLRFYYQAAPDAYLRLIRKYPADIEKAATVGVLYDFYAYLLEKFAYIPFYSWCAMVPDPNDFDTVHPEKDDRLYKIVEFVFMTQKQLEEKLSAAGTSQNSAAARRRGYSVDEIKTIRNSDYGLGYEIQALRELGTLAQDYSLLPAGSFVTPEYCDEIARNNFGTLGYYGDVYTDQWDGGQLMKSVRSWVNTTTKRIVFVYGTNDAWTGGAIDSDNLWGTGTVSVNPANSNVSKIWSMGGLHSHDFLETQLTFTPEASNAIKQALDQLKK